MNLKITKLIENDYYFFIFIFFSTILFHYFPFERASIGPDDFAFLTKENILLENFIKLAPDRPLHYLFVELQNIIISDNAFFGLIFNIAVNLLLLFTIYSFLTFFIKSKINIILILIIYNFFLSKVEIYHYPIFSYPIIANILYLWSLIFFMKSFLGQFRYNILISTVLYLIAIFFYEIGFFIPLIFFIYTITFKYEYFVKYLKIFFIFFFIAVIYYVYRETNAFGFSDIPPTRNANFTDLKSSFASLFNIFGGRSFLRITIYGYLQFFNIPKEWLISILFLDIIFLIIVYYFFQGLAFVKIEVKTIVFFFFILIIFLIPNILVGGTGGRHTIIPIIFISLIIYIFLTKAKKYNILLIITVIGLQLIPNQGNNWTQIISSRINAEIYQSLDTELREELNQADTVVFNRKSFADNIDNQIIINPLNILHTYYGAQALENWGLRSKIYLKSNLPKNKIYISINNPKEISKNKYIFKEHKNLNVNENLIKEKVIESKNLLYIDFNKVFPNGFLIN